MTRKRLLVFIFTLLFSVTLVGAVNLAVPTIRKATEPHFQRMLDTAAQRGEVRRMRLFVLLGADVNGRSYPMFICGNATEDDLARDFHFPLQSAASTGQTGAVELLLAEGARIDEMDGYGRTALWHAALGSHPEVVRILLASGANPRISHREFPSDVTPLEKAAQEGAAEIVAMLLAHGAGQDRQLDSALWEAIWRNKTETARFLLSQGASVDYVKLGRSMLMCAEENRNAELIKLLEQAGARR